MAKRANQNDPIVEFPEDEPLDSEGQAILHGYQPPQALLTEAMVMAALGQSGLRLLGRLGALAVVVELPGAAWAEEVERVVRDLTFFTHVFNRTGASKLNDRSEFGNERVSACLARGERVVGISQAPDTYLPTALMASADLRVRLRPPTNRMVSAAIRKATGRSPRRMPENVSAGLSLDELAGAIRRGSSPAACVRRLIAASRTRLGGTDTGVAEAPPLSELHGYGEALTWSLALVRDLGEYRAGRLPWSAISKNCTFDSAPGLGKTSLVRSIARSANLPLVTTSVSSWFSGSNGYLDGVLKEAHRVMALAASQALSILFLDELDSLPNRATISNRGKDWWVPVVNGILLALDSTISGPTSQVIVIGASNHADQLDAALVRPGRLYPVIRIGPPDADALAGILRQHLAGDLADQDLMGLAHLGVGASGAEAVAWVRDARRTARAAGRPMRISDLADRIAPSDAFSPYDLDVAARHEASHAVAAEILGTMRVREVSVALRPGSAGMTHALRPQRLMATKAQIEAEVVVALAGRAQDGLLGEPNTGSGGEPHSDIAIATAQVLLSHVTYGLAGNLTYLSTREDAFLLLQRDPNLQVRVENDLRRLYKVAEEFVVTYRDAIEGIARRLVSDRVVTGFVVRELIALHEPGVATAVTVTEGTSHVR